MYRQYENPFDLEEELRLVRVQKDRLMEIGEYDDEAAEQFAQQESELQDRINYAWQDIEFEENQRMIDGCQDIDESFCF